MSVYHVRVITTASAWGHHVSLGTSIGRSKNEGLTFLEESSRTATECPKARCVILRHREERYV